MSGENQKHILFCVLNWGLGHATRSVPLIHAALARGHRVTLASDGHVLDFLAAEFPDCPILRLPGYNVRYPFGNAVMNILLYGLQVLRAIAAERKAIHKYVRDHPVDVILSDNRYGCYADHLPSVLISHQLHLRGLEPTAARLGERFIRSWADRFSSIWIPDFADRQTALAGEMSSPIENIPCRYLGPLSSCVPLDRQITNDLLVVLSGPEPQRTRFEQKILEQLPSIQNLRVLLIRGKTGPLPTEIQHPGHRILPLLQRKALNEALAESALVLCRSGYSSVMDLIFMQKPAILVPTSGQPEQEYIADRLADHPLFITTSQSKFDLKDLLHRVKIKRTGDKATDLVAGMQSRIDKAFLSFGL